MIIKNISSQNPVIAWWSGGVTSAVTCKLCVDWFGIDNVRVVFIDTKNEYPDTYVFKQQCEKWYGCPIETITSPYKSIQDVWYQNLSLNTATGAICSYHLKRMVRIDFQNKNKFSYSAFGFECEKKEIKRAKAMKLNNPDSFPFFPLISELLDKPDCIKIIQKAKDIFLFIEVPKSYYLGYNNNNCGETGCVQGGIGYWQLTQKIEPEKFDRMALVEHEITDLKGEPVTMLKDQSKGGGLVFLKPHPKYPHIKDISMMKGRPSKPLMECNGFCGINDITERSQTETELNYAK